MTSTESPFGSSPTGFTTGFTALILVAMALDAGTWMLVPEPIRAQAESNPLATSVMAVLLLKVAATLVILALISRLRHHQRFAVLVVVAITLVGAASNLRGLVG